MRAVSGLMVDPVDGTYPGVVRIEASRIVSVDRTAEPEGELHIFPGFVDLQVYDPEPLVRSGVTGYLLATRTLVELPDERCVGLHLEGPFLNPEAAGAIPVDELRPIDLLALDRWLEDGRARLVTLSPELPDALQAIELIASAGAVAAIGHTLANAATAGAAIGAGARFATHVWNAFGPVGARSTGAIPELLLDSRVVLGLIADGRHLHPRIEELTVRAAGHERIALTSDLVLPPAQTEAGKLLGGDRAGAALVARMARFGLPAAAGMASLVPARLLGLDDRGRLAPGFRADVAVLDRELRPVETLWSGETVWSGALSSAQIRGRNST
ncbi:MAG TPA: amidohydrolase family protein [Gaiellaceae bacterium]|nr:amidohydrolase family protein [Gaiellaceae bacterium]